MSDLVRPHPSGAVLRVRAVPGASVAKVMGVQSDELRVKVCSPPVDGRANEELCELLAAVLGLRRREVEVVAGQTARSKQVLVTIPAADLQERLGPWIGGSDDARR